MSKSAGLMAFASVFLFAVMAMSATAYASNTAFQNGRVVTLSSTPASACTSTLSALYLGYPPAVNASAVTNCEVGAGISNTVGLHPMYQLVPSFAGPSIYGFTYWNSTAQGYPSYNGMTVVTSCGADGTPAACNLSINRGYYSPSHSAFEAALGITKGVFGLPQGVLPHAARDTLLPNNEGNIPNLAYVVRIGVYDPNLLPNTTTGRCTQVVASNLSNPLNNCLNNTAALARALNTTDSAVVAANRNNVLYLVQNTMPYQATLALDNVTQTKSILNHTYITIVTPQTTKKVNASNTNVEKWALLTSATTVSNSTTAFQNGNLVEYAFTDTACASIPYNTTEARNASGVTTCEIGSASGANILAGALPIWIIVPAFAGPSIYGLPNYTTSKGYPIYNGTIITTDCGIGNSSSACPGKPIYYYSPVFGIIERALGITKGVAGLPEGVVANPARSYIASPLKNSTYSPSYLVRVVVFDPNIFPNATTGKCRVIAPSSLSNPTADCLTSASALAAALSTTDNAIAVINANNPLWTATGMPLKQAALAVITQNPKNLSNPYAPQTYAVKYATNALTPNTDQTSWSFVGAVSQPTTVSTTVATTIPTTVATTVPTTASTTVASAAQVMMPSGSAMTYAAVIVVALIVIIVVAYAMMRKKVPAAEQPPPEGQNPR